MNVPKLRFKEFNDEWIKTTLGDCSESLSYGLNAAAKEFDGENQYLRITDIDEASRMYIKKNKVSPEGPLSEGYLLKESDIVFARTGASTGKTYIYKKNDGKLYFAGFLIRARIKNDCNPTFIYNQTLNNKYNKWVKVMSMRSGQPGINSTEYASFEFYLPKLEEQKKIADFMSLLNKKIQLQQEKINLLKEQKKGYMQRIFKQGICFKGENGEGYSEWESTTLNKIATKISKKNKDLSVTNVISNSAKNGLISQNDYFDKDIANKENIGGYYVISKGDFVYNPRISSEAPYGPINIYHGDFDGIVSPLYTCFRVENVNREFMYYYFKSPLWHKYIYINGDSGARHDRVSIKDSTFFEMNILLPCKQEQEKIADFLSDFDRKIQLEQQKIQELQEQKAGFMQQMFA